MKTVYLTIEGADIKQAKYLTEELNEIDDVKTKFCIKEFAPPIEFKAIFTDVVIEIGKGVIIGLIIAAILKFFNKIKSLSGKPLIIKIKNNYGTVNIVQGESKEDIEEKAKQILGS